LLGLIPKPLNIILQLYFSMKMTQKLEIINWRLEDEKIILSLVDEEGKTFDVELPEQIYKEILTDGPPSEEKKMRELIDKIHGVRVNQALAFEELINQIKSLDSELQTAIAGLQQASTKTEILKYSAIVRAIGKRKALRQELRLLLRQLLQREGEYRAELARLEQGKA